MRNKSHKNIQRRWGMLGLAALIAGAVGAPDAQAQTIAEALGQAYLNNPTLQAQRAQLRSTDEGVPQALSGWRPDVRFLGDLTKLRRRTNNIGGFGGGNDSRTTYSGRFRATQNVYEGGRTEARISQAQNDVSAERARLVNAEQQVLLDAVTAYMNVVRDQAVLQLNINNEQVLKRQLEATRDRFNVGEVTRTDVAQAESRFARSTAVRIQSEGALEVSRAFYEQIIGAPPSAVTQPDFPNNLPKSEKDAVAAAREMNPAVVTAVYTERAARDAVKILVGALLPSVDIVADASRSRNQGTADRTTDDITLSAELTIPLYQQGTVTSQVREAKQAASQRFVQIEEARRAAAEDAARTWEQLVTARASIKSRESEVRAGKIALEGVEQEAAVGSRTVLDVLDAEQELLDAQVSLVRDQRDAIVASYDLLSAVGQLTAKSLALPVKLYDFENHYNKVRGKYWDFDSYSTK